MNVSVVIPLYNKAAYVARTIESVLAQTYRDFELIVVDDGSTDGGGDIVRQIVDSRIRVITQENAGVSAARNRGVAEATTDWVAFLDADDEWYPTFLERTTAFVEQYPDVGAVITNFTIDTTGKKYVPPSAAQEGILPDFFATELEMGACPVFCSSILVRRKALMDIGGFPVGVLYGEDVDTWNRLACENAIGFIAEPLALFCCCVERTCARFQEEPFAIPCVARTLRGDWASRIPQHLKRSADEYVNLAILKHVSLCFSAGRIGKGYCILLTQCRPTQRTWRKYFRMWYSGLQYCVPLRLRSIYRRFVPRR